MFLHLHSVTKQPHRGMKQQTETVSHPVNKANEHDC